MRPNKRIKRIKHYLCISKRTHKGTMKRTGLLIFAALLTLTVVAQSNTSGPRQKAAMGTDFRITDGNKFFRKGDIVIKGRFGKNRPEVVEYRGIDPVVQGDNPQVFEIAGDGTFTAIIPVEHPVLSTLKWADDDIVHFYGEAGDTIHLTFDEEMRVSYGEGTRHTKLLTLLNSGDPTFYLPKEDVRKTADEKPFGEFAKWCEEKYRELRAKLAKLTDFEMVFITSDSWSPLQAYKKFTAEHLKDEEVYRIPHRDWARLMSLFNFVGIPHHEMIMPDGKIMKDPKDFELDNQMHFAVELEKLMGK